MALKAVASAESSSSSPASSRASSRPALMASAALPMSMTVSSLVVLSTGLAMDAAAVSAARGLATPALRARNPEGLTPWLIDGDFGLGQTIAIMLYIDAMAPYSGLFGDGSTHQRATTMQWLALLNADLHAAMAPLFAPTMFLQGPGAAELLRPQAQSRAFKMLSLIDRALEEGKWLVAGRTCADAYLYVVTRWVEMLDIDISTLENLKAYALQLDNDPGVAAVMRRERIV